MSLFPFFLKLLSSVMDSYYAHVVALLSSFPLNLASLAPFVSFRKKYLIKDYLLIHYESHSLSRVLAFHRIKCSRDTKADCGRFVCFWDILTACRPSKVLRLFFLPKIWRKTHDCFDQNDKQILNINE